MLFLHSDIGSAKDNFKSPIHNWYKFTAGFSYKFVDEIIQLEKLKEKSDSLIYEPFAGCGTSLVSAQKNQIDAIGNEGQEFMFDIIEAKLNWDIEDKNLRDILNEIQTSLLKQKSIYNLDKTHPLLLSLYSIDNLKTLLIIRDEIGNIIESKYRSFLKLALSQTLHKVSIHPIAVPYISRNKVLKNNFTAWEVFEKISIQMLNDLSQYRLLQKTSKIYLHDSRKTNPLIPSNSCNICITSPPYLNNLDYGEVSKVHTHFFGITDNWNDITNKVRRELVTGATTHYADKDFKIDDYKLCEFYLNNKQIADELIKISTALKDIALTRGGKKSFNILALLYFQDMYYVLKEIRRVLKEGSRAYLILGDSAPYGVYIPTTEILGKISTNLGFTSFEIHKIRARGTKWKSLKFRHNLELTENVLVLK